MRFRPTAATFRKPNRRLADLLLILAVAIINGCGASPSPDAPGGAQPASAASEAPTVELPDVAEQSPEAAAAFRDVLETAKSLLAAYPDDANSHNLMASVSNRLANSDAALYHWNRVIELNPAYADAYYGMGLIANSRGDYAAATGYFRRGAALNSSSSPLLTQLAQSLMGQGQLEVAAGVLRQYVQAKPTAMPAFALLGQIHVQLSQYAAAIPYFERALELSPDYSSAFYGLASAHAGLGNTDQSRKYFSRFRELRDREGKEIRREMQQYEDIDGIRQFAASAHATAGNVYLLHQDYQATERQWRTATKLNPGDVEHRRALASMLVDTGRPEEAVKLWQELIEQEPDNTTAYIAKGVTLFQMKRYADAEKSLQKVIDLQPDLDAGYATLASCIVQSDGDFARARSLALKAVDLSPTAVNYALLCSACQGSGDTRGAREAIEQAIKLAPQNPEYQQMQAGLR